MVLKINGTDITPLIASGGLQWSREDLDGPNAGRAIDGTTYRDRIASKNKWEITCRPLTSQELAKVLTLLAPEYIKIQTIDPVLNIEKEFEVFTSSIPAQYLMNIGGKEYWAGVAFSIIER